MVSPGRPVGNPDQVSDHRAAVPIDATHARSGEGVSYHFTDDRVLSWSRDGTLAADVLRGRAERRSQAVGSHERACGPPHTAGS